MRKAAGRRITSRSVSACEIERGRRGVVDLRVPTTFAAGGRCSGSRATTSRGSGSGLKPGPSGRAGNWRVTLPEPYLWAQSTRRKLVTDFAQRLSEALGTGFRIERELGGGGMSRVFL